MQMSATDQARLVKVVEDSALPTDHLIQLIAAERWPGINKLVLRSVSAGSKVIIKPCDGRITIAKSKAVFKSYIDDDFENWGLDQPSVATAEMQVEVYEMFGDSTLSNMLSYSSHIGLSRLLLTQAQIVDFCVNQAGWLQTDGYGTFSFFRKDEKLPATPDNVFVADVGFDDDGLEVRVIRFDGDGVWYGGDRHRVVLPQLTSMPL